MTRSIADENPRADVAARMQDRGFAPVLLKTNSTTTASMYWNDGPPEDVASVLRMDPRGNLGWRLGVQPNGKRLLAIEEGGAFPELGAILGELPPTWRQITSLGTPWRVYRIPPLLEMGARARVSGYGCDIRADGRQLCIAPSVVLDAPYHLTHRLPLGELPERWLSACIVAPEPEPERMPEGAKPSLARALKYTACCEPSISGSGGHHAAFRVASKCKEFGLTVSETLHVLRVFNERCQPPWSEKELLHKAEQAHSMSRVQRGGKLAASAARARMPR